MPAPAPDARPVALSLAEKATCKVVYGALRPRPLLLPLGLELWLYAQKTHGLRRPRAGRWAGVELQGKPSRLQAAPQPCLGPVNPGHGGRGADRDARFQARLDDASGQLGRGD